MDDADKRTRYKRLAPIMDRVMEAHFWLHNIDKYYHIAEPFRWNLNAFLRALKEVPDMITMACQNMDGFKAWYAPKKAGITQDPLLRLLAKNRDYIVHQGTLLPNSTVMVGITQGRGVKFGLGAPLDPRWDSDFAMERMVMAIRATGDDDFLGIETEDDESLPCVERQWILPEFPDDNAVELCGRAWMQIAEVVKEVYNWAGLDLKAPGLECRHDLADVRLRLYSRKDIAAGRFVGRNMCDIRPQITA